MSAKIGRDDAARVITALLIDVAESGGASVDTIEILSRLGLALPKRCTGEAHRNSHQDNCSLCAPHWGWIVAPIEVER